MVYTNYLKQRALHLRRKGFRSPTITKQLRREGLKVSRKGIHNFLVRFRDHQTIGR